MGVLVLVLLVLAALTGALGAVLRIAAGVALGIVLAVVAISFLVMWRVRRALRGPRDRWRSVRGSSHIEVLRRDEDE